MADPKKQVKPVTKAVKAPVMKTEGALKNKPSAAQLRTETGYKFRSLASKRGLQTAKKATKK